jgi:hypothetical protein
MCADLQDTYHSLPFDQTFPRANHVLEPEGMNALMGSTDKLISEHNSCQHGSYAMSPEHRGGWFIHPCFETDIW